MSQTTTEYPPDPAWDGAFRESPDGPQPADGSRPALVSVGAGPGYRDQLSTDLHVIALTNRVLASRVSELDAELRRQVAAAEHLHPGAAAEFQRNVGIDALAELRAELTAWQSTRLYRLSTLPRRVSRRLRRFGSRFR